MRNPANKEKIEGGNYEEATKTIKKTLTDKTRGTTNEFIKAAKKSKERGTLQIQPSMQGKNNTTQANSKKRIYGIPNSTQEQNRKCWCQTDYENAKTNPQYNLGSKKEGTRMYSISQ